MHREPSGNSNLFEVTTAQKLADIGFYIIVYDRRGEGRSKEDNATTTFQESFDDLNQIYKLYHLEKANILAHSFGGIRGTFYTNQYLEKVKSLILAAALVSQQETYNHILEIPILAFKNDKNKLL
ncbi:alpha/beta fold hydrolase [Chryseobacterium sp. TY4]